LKTKPQRHPPERNEHDPRILNVNIPKDAHFDLKTLQDLYFYRIMYADKLIDSYQDSDKTKGIKLNFILRLCDTIERAIKIQPDIERLNELVKRLEQIEQEYELARKSGLLTERVTKP
jgi:hypothetical protein